MKKKHQTPRRPETVEHIKIPVQHLPSDYAKQCTVPCGHSSCDPIAFTEEVADQEQRWGEERVSANE
jgi:hypothetical protein